MHDLFPLELFGFVSEVADQLLAPLLHIVVQVDHVVVTVPDGFVVLGVVDVGVVPVAMGLHVVVVQNVEHHRGVSALQVGRVEELQGVSLDSLPFVVEVDSTAEHDLEAHLEGEL